MQEFPKSVADQIGYYVYMLKDPKKDQVFYIGKGTRNRVFAHVQEALDNPCETDKLQRIRDIKNTLGLIAILMRDRSDTGF